MLGLLLAGCGATNDESPRASDQEPPPFAKSYLPASPTARTIATPNLSAPSREAVSEPATAEQHYQDGFRAFELNAYDVSVASYTAAIAVRADYKEAFAGRGHAHLARGAYKAAVEDYAQSVRIDATYEPGWYGRALAQWVGGNLAGSESDYRKLLELSPGNDWYHQRLSVVLYEAKKPDDVLKLYAAARGRYPDALWSHTGYLQALLDQEQLQQLVNECDALIAASKHAPTARYYKGIAYLRGGDAKTARDILRTVVKDFPDDPAAWELLAEACEKLGDRSGMDEALKKARDIRRGRGY